MQMIGHSMRHRAAFLLALGLGLPVLTQSLGAQVSTTGRLTGTLLDERNVPVPDAGLTLSRDGTVLRVVRGALNGRFEISGLAPGAYTVLAEQVGYQPVRISAIPVSADQTTSLTFRLERRPPPVAAPVEVPYAGVGPSRGGNRFEGRALERFDRFRNATDLGRDVSGVISSFEGNGGGSLGAFGLVPGQSILLVDGLQESTLRHPGYVGEGGAAPIFARDGLEQVDFYGWAPSSLFPTAAGGGVAMTSRFGSSRSFFRPWLSYSGSSLGGAAVDNPADSAASSFGAGIALGGPLKGDTASWFLRFNYQQLAQPSAAPLTSLDGTLAAAIATGGAPTALAAPLSPVVRGWSGFTGQAGAAYKIGKEWRLSGRLGVASWDEDAPSLTTSLVNGSGSRVEASDLSAAVGVSYTSEQLSSTTSAGFYTSSRTWSVGSIPYTTLGSESIGFGAEASLPGSFDESMAQVGQLFSAPFGRHEFRVGGMVGQRRFTYDWLTDGAGQASFGSLGDYVARTGSFVRSSATSPAEAIAILEYAAFAEGIFHVTPQVDVTVGARLQVEKLPTDLSTASLPLAESFGISNLFVPTSRSSSIGPRLGVTWRPGTSQHTELHVGGGLVPGRWDRASVAEVARRGGNGVVHVERGLGQVGWPTATGLTRAEGYTLFTDGVKAPRTLVVDGTLRHAIAPGTIVSVGGGYRHTDYLLRRGDLNRPAAPLRTGSDLRPIWGALEQVGSLIAPTPGSNTRFREFDRVYGLVSDGFSDVYEVRLDASRSLGEGFEVQASYTWSRSRDNLVGARSSDPADRLTPLDGAAAAPEWDVGRSDLDIPHRLAATLRWSTADQGLTLGARVRLRSGLPYTAGFPLGTDVNGDGSGANDPVATASVAGLSALLDRAGCDVGSSAFALRNGCREPIVSAVDAQASVRLPFGGGGVRLTIDAFNLAASATGRVDRAAVKIAPAGSITQDAQGRLVLPLILNDNFGNLLVRRNDPRTIRIGLRVEK